MSNILVPWGIYGIAMSCMVIIWRLFSTESISSLLYSRYEVALLCLISSVNRPQSPSNILKLFCFRLFFYLVFYHIVKISFNLRTVFSQHNHISMQWYEVIFGPPRADGKTFVLITGPFAYLPKKEDIIINNKSLSCAGSAAGGREGVLCVSSLPHVNASPHQGIRLHSRLWIRLLHVHFGETRIEATVAECVPSPGADGVGGDRHMSFAGDSSLAPHGKTI